MLKTLASLTIILSVAHGYPRFQGYIPNGNRVPNPCHPTDMWPGVGHQAIGGSGPRNPFGLDFFANNETWTKELCMKDSDGDGRKNGEELGDPECVWTQNGIPKFTTNLSHPGVCEPVTDSKCHHMNSWLTCPDEFNCPAFQLNTTKSLKLVIPQTAVPPNETTYICHAFKMPNDTKYHGIGMIPEIVNKEIMHHILLFGCSDTPSDELLNKAVPCGMGSAGCQTIIGLWSVGQDGECHPDEYGFPIGNGGYQYTLIQLHWNNPQLKTGLTDSSGLTFYYTEKLRPNDAMVVMTGQQFLEIPPQTPSITFEGTCKQECTKLIQPPSVNISAAFLHMHYQGISGSINMLRNGQVYKVLSQEDRYDYNSPVTIMHQPPIEFKAGDEIKVTCEFQSMNKNKTTYWGEGTQDEMCYGFITIYPAVKDFDVCVEYKQAVQCSMPQFDIYRDNGCMIRDFQSLMLPIATYCSVGNCSNVCMVLMNGLAGTGCLGKTIWPFIEEYWPQFSDDFAKWLPIVKSCWPNTTAILPTTTDPATTHRPENPGCGPFVNAASIFSPEFMFSSAAAIILGKLISD